MHVSPYDDGWLSDMEIPCASPCLRGKHGRMRTLEQVRLVCAEAAHEMNRVYCQTLGDFSQPSWASAEDHQRTSAINGVDGVFGGNSPKASHESWMAEKAANGWVFGEKKDSEAKTHPCMVPYDQLSEDQKQKDFLFVSTVLAMAMALGHQVLQVPASTITAGDALVITTRSA